MDSASFPIIVVSSLACIRAVIKYERKRSGSLSPSSKESQASLSLSEGLYSVPNLQFNHPQTNVVFPKPAGAEIRDSFLLTPSFSLVNNRTRETNLERCEGMKSLVVRIEVAIV